MNSTSALNSVYQGGLVQPSNNYVTLGDTASSATNAGPSGVSAIPPVKTYSGTDSLLVTIPVYGGVAAKVPTFGGADTYRYGTLSSSYGAVQSCGAWQTTF